MLTQRFKANDYRTADLKRFLNFYNTVKSHKDINNLILFEKLEAYLLRIQCKQLTEI